MPSCSSLLSPWGSRHDRCPPSCRPGSLGQCACQERSFGDLSSSHDCGARQGCPRGEGGLGARFCKTQSTGGLQLVSKEQLPFPPLFCGEGHIARSGPGAQIQRHRTLSELGPIPPLATTPKHFFENSLFRMRCVLALGHLAHGFLRVLAQMRDKVPWFSAERAIFA